MAFHTGFFDLGPAPDIEPPKKRGKVMLGGCSECGMSDCWDETPEGSPIPYQGQGKKKILVVLESPSREALQEGDLTLGSRNSFLREFGKRISKTFWEDCWVTYAARCPLPTGKDDGYGYCKPKLQSLISELKPAVIIPMGIRPVMGVIWDHLAGRITNVSPHQFFGKTIPDREVNAWVCPTYGADDLRDPRRNKVERMFAFDHIKRAWSLAGKAFPEVPTQIETVVQDYTLAIKWINEARESKSLVGFDYETTGIKPHREGHRIVCASIAFKRDGNWVAYAFPWFGDRPEFLEAWKGLMTDRKVKRVAHKGDFEQSWTYFRANGPGVEPYWPGPYEWDTCLGAHCINNNAPTGLKFEVYTRLGIASYDAKVDMWVTKTYDGEDGDSTNAFNKLYRPGPGFSMLDLLEYNAKDSLYMMPVCEAQQAEMDNDHQLEGFYFFLDGGYELTKVQNAGMHLRMEMLDHQWGYITEKMVALEKEILTCPEARKWPGPDAFKHTSNKHLQILLYDVLGYRSQNRAVDEPALSKLNSPLCKSLLAWRRWQKMRDTYLAQFKREAVDGVVRPFFNLHKVVTFRSSSDSPNFQNIPKRDKEAQKIIRSLIRPREGNRIYEWDYKAVEVCISACYHKDPTMIRYIEDPTTDMHRDMACEIFLRDLKTIRKQERQWAKNKFVFPSFYGATSRSMAPDLWEVMDEETRAHVKSHGLTNPDKWLNHILEIERHFWEDRFKVYSRWKRSMYARYEEEGFIPQYTGFRCYGPVGFTEGTNRPIQGSAFHCLLWDITEVAPLVRGLSGRSHLIGQIHDAMVGDIHPDEEDQVNRIIWEYGTKKIREAWPWIIVPLTIEAERSAVNGTWAEMESIGALGF